MVDLEGGEGLDATLTTEPRTLLREVAHMLRSPLASIAILAETLRDESHDLTEEARGRQLDIIHRAALGLAATADDLLTLTEGGGGSDAAHERIPLVELLGSIGRLVEPLATSRGTSVAVRAGDGDAYGSRRLVQRALVALGIRTALGVRDGAIELVARPEGDDVRVEILARGWVGTDARAHGSAALLDVYRDEPDTRSYTVSAEGLGLIAARGLLRRMDADLAVDAPEEGSIVLSFRLPQAAYGEGVTRAGAADR